MARYLCLARDVLLSPGISPKVLVRLSALLCQTIKTRRCDYLREGSRTSPISNVRKQKPFAMPQFISSVSQSREVVLTEINCEADRSRVTTLFKSLGALSSP